jgi:hypothetical protein
MALKVMMATVDILIEDDELADARAADTIAETLRPLTKKADAASPIIDWRYNGGVEGYAEDHNGVGFEYYEEGSDV